MSPVRAEHGRELIEQKGLRFDILHDPGNEVAHAYGLRWAFPEDLKGLYLKFGIDLAAANGDDSWTLPLPARYVIDRDGIVRYARVNADYTRRPEPEETVQAVRALGK